MSRYISDEIRFSVYFTNKAVLTVASNEKNELSDYH